MIKYMLMSRFAGGITPMPPPPNGDAGAKDVFDKWLAWVNKYGITDLAAKCVQNRAAQVAKMRKGKPDSTWGNGSCFAVVEVLTKQGSVADVAGWSTDATVPEGQVHAERAALSRAFHDLGDFIAVTRAYVELEPCNIKSEKQEDTCTQYVNSLAPNAVVMFSHWYPADIPAWKILNTAMAKEDGLYLDVADFRNPGHAEERSDDQGKYVTWQSNPDKPAEYHKMAKVLMQKFKDDSSVPFLASARS